MHNEGNFNEKNIFNNEKLICLIEIQRRKRTYRCIM
jgi:hypothetical protein